MQPQQKPPNPEKPATKPHTPYLFFPSVSPDSAELCSITKDEEFSSRAQLFSYAYGHYRSRSGQTVQSADRCTQRRANTEVDVLASLQWPEAAIEVCNKTLYRNIAAAKTGASLRVCPSRVHECLGANTEQNTQLCILNPVLKSIHRYFLCK